MKSFTTVINDKFLKSQVVGCGELDLEMLGQGKADKYQSIMAIVEGQQGNEGKKESELH